MLMTSTRKNAMHFAAHVKSIAHCWLKTTNFTQYGGFWQGVGWGWRSSYALNIIRSVWQTPNTCLRGVETPSSSRWCGFNDFLVANSFSKWEVVAPNWNKQRLKAYIMNIQWGGKTESLIFTFPPFSTLQLFLNCIINEQKKRSVNLFVLPNKKW